MKTSIDIEDSLYRRARVHAAAEGTTVRALVEEGLRRVLSAVRGPTGDRERRLRRLEELGSRVASLPILDNRSTNVLLGYDEDGSFR